MSLFNLLFEVQPKMPFQSHKERKPEKKKGKAKKTKAFINTPLPPDSQEIIYSGQLI